MNTMEVFGCSVLAYQFMCFCLQDNETIYAEHNIRKLIPPILVCARNKSGDIKLKVFFMLFFLNLDALNKVFKNTPCFECTQTHPLPHLFPYSCAASGWDVQANALK